VVHQLYLELSPDGGAEAEAELGGRRIQARPYNLQDVHQLRELDPSNIDQLVAVTGMVTRVSPVIPDLKQGFFQCYTCRATAEVRWRGKARAARVRTHAGTHQCAHAHAERMQRERASAPIA
jgi:DNA replicative helicase MCM subunit Mcm2 (Cdc46/Mcm family)